MKMFSCADRSRSVKLTLLTVSLLFFFLQIALSPSYIQAAESSGASVPAISSGTADVSTAFGKTAATASGAVKKGWVSDAGKVYYFYSAGRKAAGFMKSGRRWYHFDADGVLTTGWFTVGTGRYYASPYGRMGGLLGAMYTGFRNVGGVYYSFANKGRSGVIGRQNTGWVTVSGNIYYYDSDGTRASGLKWVKGRLFYFAETGSARKRGRVLTGWQKTGGHIYYFRPSGKAGNYGAAYRSASVRIKGKKYSFSAEGYLVTGKKKKGSSSTEASSESSKSGSAVGNNARFIETIGTLAHADMENTGILASVTVAQAIVESNYGKSLLATRAHNLFGMKSALSNNTWTSAWNGQIYKKKTREYVRGRYITVVSKFRKYPDWAASIADHSAYLSGAKKGKKLRYKGLVGEKNYRKAAKIIKKGGYATAPNYVSALCAVIKKYDLTRFD